MTEHKAPSKINNLLQDLRFAMSHQKEKWCRETVMFLIFQCVAFFPFQQIKKSTVGKLSLAQLSEYNKKMHLLDVNQTQCYKTVNI